MVYRLLVLFMIICLSVTVGCTTLDQTAKIGTHEIYVLETTAFLAPSTTTVMAHNTQDGALNRINAGTGAGFLGAVAQPAATAAAGYFIGDGLEDSGDEINSVENNEFSNSGGNNAAGAIAKGGNAKAGAASASVAGAAAGAASYSKSGGSLF